MRIRDTSARAYHNLQEVLTERRWEIYQALFEHGPMTARELFRQLGCETNQSGRFTELRDMGLIQEIGTRACAVTGNTVIEWDVTSREHPLPLEKGSSRLQALERENKSLKDEVRRLKERLLDTGRLL